ncbi:MAG: hypothetical protein RQ751_13920 [Longimicrobiales bacterium]|nr:hypothetical protein [Longimicrobiales bacterium]
MNQAQSTLERPGPRRGGFALPVAVFALVIVGVLVTGGVYMARQETRIGVASKKGTEAFYLAERGIAEVLERWDASVMGTLPVFGDTLLTGTTSDGNWRVNVVKLSQRNYFLDATGSVSEGGPLLSGATRRNSTTGDCQRFLRGSRSLCTLDQRAPLRSPCGEYRCSRAAV